MQIYTYTSRAHRPCIYFCWP